MRSVGIYEARSKFAALVGQVANGETIVVTRKGKPVVELRPVAAKATLDALIDEILALNWILGKGKSLVETIREARENRAS
jgi:prevent-host-death family protein